VVVAAVTTTDLGKTPAKGLCLHETFELQTRATPDAVAVECADRSWTYAELDSYSTRLARLLRARGAAPGEFVAIYQTRSDWPIVAILACHKSGAAYVPIDPGYPGERIRHIADELRPAICLTDRTLGTLAADYFSASHVIGVDSQDAEVFRYPDTRIERAESGLSPSDLAYVIYTSGTTGRPKGVLTEHRAVAWYVQAFNKACGTSPDDRVYQGFSLSFDGSVEEIWIAFSNGSTLVVPTEDEPRFGDDLGKYLTARGVTYLSTVPTMLSTLGEDVPSLRTIVLSGEVCPPELVARWARPERRLLNVYGPTEATVNTTVAECRPGAPITIGRPLPGYQIHIVDGQLRPITGGGTGELLISGPTLARGYVNAADLTSERFLTSPHLPDVGRCYRTGDLVSWTADHELAFHGRIDTQVKIRGFRIELSEIEAVLREHPRVLAAAVQVIERDGLTQLAACVVPKDSPLSQQDRDSVLDLLEAKLTAYMIPGYLDEVERLPRTTSGKVDRGSLPDPVLPLVRTARVMVTPRSDLERDIAEVWQEAFAVPEVSVYDDFFKDLGGYSLVAAQMVTRLRTRIPQDVTVRDVYECPTIHDLASRLESRRRQQEEEPDRPAPGQGPPRRTPSAQEVFEALPRFRWLRTVTYQVLSLYLLSAIPSLPLMVLLLVLFEWLGDGVSTTRLVTVWIAVPLLIRPVTLALSIAAKWVLIGRYQPGEHPLWGSYYFRWWLCGRLQAFSGVGGLVGTPILPIYFRLMGTKVGPRCTLDTAQVGAWDLVSIGADTSIGTDTQLLGYRVEDGLLRLGRVDLGQGCFVGIHSALGLGVRMGDGSRLDDQSLLPDGGVIPPGEGWRGSPATPATVDVPAGIAPGRWRTRRVLFGLAHLVAAELVGLLPILPFVVYVGCYVLTFLAWGPAGLGVALVATVPLGVVTSCLFLAVMRRLILARMTPGTYPVESVTYIRKWLSDGLMRGARAALLPVYTTLYLPPWLRLMGAKIGPRAELSTVWNFAPELIDVGPESFFADGSIIGGRRTHRGQFRVSVNRIGRRSFVGNSAVLPVGRNLGDGCLLGVQSVSPSEPATTPDGSEWLGSPPFRLSARPVVGDFDDSVIFTPPLRLYLQRAVIDGLRILIPGYLTLVGLLGFVLVLYSAWRQVGLAFAFGIAPVVGMALSIGVVGVVAVLKKCVMGTFKPEIKPLWSMYVWLNEMINGAYESVVTPILSPFLGTPFVAPLLRWMGCNIGRRTFLASTLLSEFDLVEIGDYAALNQGVVVQNHLFEDRVFKSSNLKIGPEVSVGNMSVILYDTDVERGAVIGPLSLLMKGETLPAGTRWRGIPTERVESQGIDRSRR
jgi:non-ribosomal peptide synthetase-like protein